uniref:Chondroitin proteoglycan 4 domain-containing protein n=2 Tax=Panagrolaimus TaxID=55784 RepID=A0A914R177_9BILA
MNKFCIFVFAAIFAVGFSHPMYRKEFDKIINSNDCLKTCMSNLTIFDEEISLMKNPNLQRYFGKIDKICGIIEFTRKCIDKCGIESNPFSLESLNVVCLPESREKINEVTKCLNTKPANIYSTCAGYCGDYDKISESVHQLTQKISENELKNATKVNEIMEKTNEACGIYKCFTQCNVETVKNYCGKNVGNELQQILQNVFDAQFHDLQKLNLLETMPKTVPSECNYMFDPSIIFGYQQPQQQSDISNPQNLQIELLLKQLKLIDRQNELINRENQKIDLEMAVLSQKFEKKFESPYLFH